MPSSLASEAVTVLNLYGSLFYAGARTLENDLPRPGNADKPVVVLRIRGESVIGATAFSVLSAYAEDLSKRGGRLYLSGVDKDLIDQFESSGRIDSGGTFSTLSKPRRRSASRLVPRSRRHRRSSRLRPSHHHSRTAILG